MQKNNGQFKKGQKPWNAGIHFTVLGCQKTWFKKGCTHEQHELGYESFRDDGYLWIKYKQPNVFVLKHRIIYSWYHDEILTSKDIIIFLDGNTLNFSKENLEKITRSELMVLNNLDFKQYPLIARKTLLYYVRLNLLIKRLSK